MLKCWFNELHLLFHSKTNKYNIYPAPVQTHRKLQWSWVRFLVDLLACVAVLSVSFRLSETCAKDAQDKKEQTKPCFKIYILRIIRVDATVSSSVHWHKAQSLLLHETVTMIGPTLLKQRRKAIQHVQTYTIKCLSLRTYHLLIFQS